MLVVAAAREEELPDAPLLNLTVEGLDREAHLTRLRLQPLSRAATAQLVGLLARRRQETRDLVQLGEEIWRTGEGNPFVVIETMRARLVAIWISVRSTGVEEGIRTSARTW